MNNKEYAINVNNISKQYKIFSNPKERLKQLITGEKKKYYKEFWALKDINFSVKRGEAVGIIGRNGSGKSTLLQIISGVLKQTSGDIQVNGRIAALLELGSGFNPEFTGRENVYLNGSILGISKEEMDRRFGKIVEFADIGDFVEQPVKLYSSGMFVRLAFAVQALIEPDILIVDEALSVGDEKFQRKCFAYIEGLKKRGTSILIVSHSTGMIEKFTDRCILLEGGKVHGINKSKYVIDQYHALLYSSESAYLKMLNNQIKKDSKTIHDKLDTIKGENVKVTSNESNDIEVIPKDEFTNRVFEKNTSEEQKNDARALIEEVCIKDKSGEKKELFKVKEDLTIEFTVKVIDDIPAMQAGIRLRTVEGVEVYGTSTEYFNNSPENIKANSLIKFKYNLKGNLCDGTYFLSVAIAEKISKSEMIYLDKRSDVLVLKIKQFDLEGTGVAYLEPKIECEIIN